MVLTNASRVGESSTTTGLGDFTLLGALTGYRGVSAGIGIGNQFHYLIEDGVNWEVGIGAVLTSTTFQRVEVYKSSNADALVNWGAGTKNVWCIPIAERAGLEPFNPWGYIVYCPDGATVVAVEGATGKRLFTGTDWGAIVNSVIGQTGPTEFSIFIDPRVPNSTTTINVNKSNVTLFSPKKAAKPWGGPFVQKVLIGTLTSKTTDFWLHGIYMDELQIQAQSVSFDTEGGVIEKCAWRDWNVAGRRGLRITGAGDVEHIDFLDCYGRVEVSGTSQANPVSMVSFENTTNGCGHFMFLNFWGENDGGFNNCSTIVYRDGGTTGPRVVFEGLSVVHINGTNTGCHILTTNAGTPVANAGPSALHIQNCTAELQSATEDMFVILNGGAIGVRFYVTVDNLLITTGAFVYNFIVNSHTGTFVSDLKAGLFIHGGTFYETQPTSMNIGTPGANANFEVSIESFNWPDNTAAQRQAALPTAVVYAKRLGVVHSNATVTGTKVSELDAPSLQPGTYVFKYVLVCRTSVVTTGIGLGINVNPPASGARWKFGTRLWDAGGLGTGTGNAADNQVNPGVMVSGDASGVFSTTAPNLINAGFQTITQDTLIIIEGLFVLSAVGTLELWHSSETANNTDIMDGSSLILTKVA